VGIDGAALANASAFWFGRIAAVAALFVLHL
jgi:hypothetical protein